MKVKRQHALTDRRNDLYETHTCAVRTLIHFERLQSSIWEPCAGRGAICKVLNDHEIDCWASDLVPHDNPQVPYIKTHVDFLMERQAPCKQIVTNPPYKLANDFIRHGIDLGCDCIMLLPASYMAGANRSDLIDCHLDHVWYGIERLPFMHRDGWEGPKTESSMFPFAWFYFNAEKHVSDRGFHVRRVSWRG